MPRLAGLILIALSISTLHAQSFSCRKAMSPRERAVCADRKLRAMDSRLASDYSHLRRQLSPVAFSRIQQDQRSWLTYIDRACPAHGKSDRADITACLTNEYATRIQDLTGTTRLSSGKWLFTLAEYSIGHTSHNDNNPLYPGFDVLHVAFPQIDNPSESEQAFNRASGAAAHAFPADPVSERSVTWTLNPSNERLLSIDFRTYINDYGAHPLTTDAQLNFWLDTQKTLTPADLFHPPSNFQQKLIPLISAKLLAVKDARPYIFKDELPKNITAGLNDPRLWVLTRNGLEIHFQPYDVAAYVAGPQRVRLTWTELRPYLNPSLDPETLPTEKPTTH